MNSVILNYKLCHWNHTFQLVLNVNNAVVFLNTVSIFYNLTLLWSEVSTSCQAHFCCNLFLTSYWSGVSYSLRSISFPSLTQSFLFSHLSLIISLLLFRFFSLCFIISLAHFVLSLSLLSTVLSSSLIPLISKFQTCFHLLFCYSILLYINS